MAKETKKTTAKKKKVATKKETTKKATPAKKVVKKTPKKKVAAVKKADKKETTKAKKVTKKKPKKIKVKFEIQCKSGDTVSLAGSFNKWDTKKKKLKEKGKSGLFQCEMQLGAGEYEYKFCVNGDWTIDPENPNFKNNDMGTLNSFLVVE